MITGFRLQTRELEPHIICMPYRAHGKCLPMLLYSSGVQGFSWDKLRQNSGLDRKLRVTDCYVFNHTTIWHRSFPTTVAGSLLKCWAEFPTSAIFSTLEDEFRTPFRLKFFRRIQFILQMFSVQDRLVEVSNTNPGCNCMRLLFLLLKGFTKAFKQKRRAYFHLPDHASQGGQHSLLPK